jgi:hypothetical protein
MGQNRCLTRHGAWLALSPLKKSNVEESRCLARLNNHLKDAVKSKREIVFSVIAWYAFQIFSDKFRNPEGTVRREQILLKDSDSFWNILKLTNRRNE